MPAAGYGTAQRTKPRIKVLRGWDPNNPTKRSVHAPVATGTTIESGQVCSLVLVGGVPTWNLGVASNATIPYFAYEDSTDTVVSASGGLTGLCSLDSIELQTPWFVASPTPSYAFQARLGYQTRSDSPVDLMVSGASGLPSDSSATPDGNGQVLVLTLMTGYESNGATA
jgi:hypothetical protein